MGERYLIINADDLGMSESTNAAIGELFREKRITSSTLMAPCPKAGEAMDMARENKYPVGIHLTLNSDWESEGWPSIAPPDKVSSLLDENGWLWDTKRLAKHGKSSHVSLELEAQVRLMKEAGCGVDHADSHSGTLYGINGRLFFVNAFKLCRKYNLPFRFPKSPGFLKEQFAGKVPGFLYAAHRMIVMRAALMGVDLIDDMISNPHPVKQIGSYGNLRDYYIRQVAGCREGITELFLHPALPDEKLSRITPEWEKRVMEYRFLLNDDLLMLMERENIKPVSFGEAPF
ncbi:MAG: polysaccharide deacetylase family protein [Clostridia bacterium]